MPLRAVGLGLSSSGSYEGSADSHKGLVKGGEPCRKLGMSGGRSWPHGRSTHSLIESSRIRKLLALIELHSEFTQLLLLENRIVLP